MKTITTKHTVRDKHTPGPIKYHCPKGPWVANKNTVYTEAGELIAACVGLHTARLIAAAPGMVEVLGRIVRAFDPPMDLVNAHKVVESNWFRKNMDDARALLAQIDGEG